MELEGGYNRVQKEQRTATYLLLRRTREKLLTLTKIILLLTLWTFDYTWNVVVVNLFSHCTILAAA